MSTSIKRRLIKAVRTADMAHQKSGGGTNHYVVECLEPSLDEEGLVVVNKDSEADHRAALVRMVVAEQWSVAMSLTDPLLYAVGGELAIEWPGARRLAALPCAVDVVAERLGER